MKNICIIPARSNSKRIKNKNIKSFLGKPIIYYAINTAIKSKIFKEIVVSTDSKKIKKISEKFGAKVPFLRSKKLSDDFSTTKEVLYDAVNRLKYEKDYNLFCIYPTAALIKKKDLIQALKKFKSSNADALYAITSYSHQPQRALYINKHQLIYPSDSFSFKKRTQDLQKLFHDSGTFYIFKSSYLKKNKKNFSKKTTYYELPKNRAVDIDDIDDFNLAECIKKYTD
tara:strand:+ start:1732 stop:2412 length:681 start_codon:yes stop_codon:yes gene_type:complete